MEVLKLRGVQVLKKMVCDKNVTTLLTGAVHLLDMYVRKLQKYFKGSYESFPSFLTPHELQKRAYIVAYLTYLSILY